MIFEGKCGEPIYSRNAIVEPTLPFAAQIRQLQYGEIITIDAFVSHKPKGFSIDLEYIEDRDKTDVLMHLQVDLLSGICETNTKVHQTWNVPVKVRTDFPPGQNLCCVILVGDKGFKIAFNGGHFTEVKHQAPFKYVNKLRIEGTLDIHSITFQAGPGSARCVAGAAMPLLSQGEEPKPEADNAVTRQKSINEELMIFPSPYGPFVPFREYIPEGFTPSRALYLSVVPQKFSHQFAVDLLVGSAHAQKDIALHFKVMFQDRKVVLNTMKKGKWGDEFYRADHFPFAQGVTADLLFVCEADRFKVAVNNCHYIEYKHRYKELDNIRGLQVSEGVKLLHVRLH
nr:galectin [Arenicola marina]